MAKDQEGQPAEDQKSRALVEQLTAKGFSLDAEDDDSLLESFENLLKERETLPSRDEYERLKKLEPFATEYTTHAADFQKWRSEQAQREAQAKEPAKDEPKLSPPKIDPAAAQVVRAGLGAGKVQRNAQGLYETTDPNYSSFVHQVNEAQLRRQEFFQRFEDDPEGFIGSFTEKQLKAVEKKYSDELAAVKKEMKEYKEQYGRNAIDGYFKENWQEYWQVDAEGKQVLDAKGQGQLNAKGQAYVAAMKQLEDLIPDHSKRHERALMMLKELPIQAAPTEPADKKSKQQKFLQRNADKPARTTDKLVEHSPKGKEATAGVLGDRKMNWDQLMEVTKAELS